VQILLKKFLYLLLIVLSFQCQRSFSMNRGDSFWDECMSNCQDWWSGITNAPLPMHAIFYVDNWSDYPCRLEFNILGERTEKILLDGYVPTCCPIFLTDLRREIKKREDYRWRTILGDLTYELSKIMHENPPMPKIRLYWTYGSEIVFSPTKFVKSKLFLIINNDQKEIPYSVLCCFADFEVGKFLLNGSLGLPKDIRLYILSYFFIFEDAYDNGEVIEWKFARD